MGSWGAWQLPPMDPLLCGARCRERSQHSALKHGAQVSGLGCSCLRVAPTPLHQPICQHSSRRRQGQLFESSSRLLGRREALLKPLGSRSDGTVRISCVRCFQTPCFTLRGECYRPEVRDEETEAQESAVHHPRWYG